MSSLFACMGFREDNAFLNCFGGAPLVEPPDDAPKRPARRKIKRWESKRKPKEKSPPPKKPESKWALLRSAVVTKKDEGPSLAQVMEQVVSLDVSETRDKLKERLGKSVSTAATKRMMLDVGVSQHGCVSPHDFETMVQRFQEDELVRKARRNPWSKIRRSPKAPKELYFPSALNADTKALAKPLPKASNVDWNQLLDAHGRDFEALFGQVNDITLGGSTSAGNTIIHYLAQIGDVERLAVVMRRDVGRQLVDKRNFKGHTALDYARARGHDHVAQTLSCYHQEHLADEHVDGKTVAVQAARGYRTSRAASCANRTGGAK